MPDDDLVCKPKNKDNLGYHAIYDVTEDAELATGVIIAASTLGVVYLFQLEDTTDILKEDFLTIMRGTLFEYLENEQCEDTIEYFRLIDCRLPLQEELDWYNSLKTV